MKETNHSHSFTSGDITRYLNREMSPAEMHAMEKAALDDPFLADAIEGYTNQHSSSSSKAIPGALKELTARLEKRTHEKRKNRILYANQWWRVAAAIMLLAGTAGIVYTLMNNSAQHKHQLAKNETAPGISADTIRSTTVDTSDATASLAFDSNITSNMAAAQEKKFQPVTRSAKDQQDTVLSSERPTTEDAIARLEEAKPQDNRSMVPERAAAAPAMAKQRNERITEQPTSAATDISPYRGNNFTGKVVNSENEPIVGASVMLENKKIGVSTDKEGNFNLLYPDSTIRIEVASVGFERARFTLRNNLSDNRIVLKEHEASLNEVVITGYGTQRKKSVTGTSNVVAEPVNGWPAYENYLEKNKQAIIKNSDVHGLVIISFLINKKGKPTDIRIEQSLPGLVDAEAIRLLKNGPAWKPVKGKARSTINIRF